MSVIGNFLQFARDEGLEPALEKAQQIQLSLECIGEIGSEDELIAAGFLIDRINNTIESLLNQNLVGKEDIR